MDKIKSLHSVSSVYFFILAFAYIVMVLAFRNGFMADFFFALMRILDIPFAFVSLMYGFTTLALQINIGRDEESSLSPWILVVLTICLILFGAVVFVNFAFPSQL
ncbi:hypothetical protein KJ657_01735 [Patescibacteria group bacterium]|nr:hypothetical protein [Patescibacteria group bacterium]MBU1015790.1 hypothetical protein [Patescibacteria group bacterium]MBU1685343.1 hypothetical protein [Patescibacteria group bacterium]MBU1938271.1 hypothetical protein [Patescibacteria group bacterium]